MPRHEQDRSREYATASATATPVDKGGSREKPCGYNTSAPHPCGWGGADEKKDYFGN